MHSRPDYAYKLDALCIVGADYAYSVIPGDRMHCRVNRPSISPYKNDLSDTFRTAIRRRSPADPRPPDATRTPRTGTIAPARRARRPAAMLSGPPRQHLSMAAARRCAKRPASTSPKLIPGISCRYQATQIGPVPQLVTRKVGKIPTSFFRFFRTNTCDHVFDH